MSKDISFFLLLMIGNCELAMILLVPYNKEMLSYYTHSEILLRTNFWQFQSVEGSAIAPLLATINGIRESIWRQKGIKVSASVYTGTKKLMKV